MGNKLSELLSKKYKTSSWGELLQPFNQINPYKYMRITIFFLNQYYQWFLPNKEMQILNGKNRYIFLFVFAWDYYPALQIQSFFSKMLGTFFLFKKCKIFWLIIFYQIINICKLIQNCFFYICFCGATTI